MDAGKQLDMSDTVKTTTSVSAGGLANCEDGLNPRLCQTIVASHGGSASDQETFNGLLKGVTVSRLV